MGRLLLFALVGGALVSLVWHLAAAARRRAQGRREAQAAAEEAWRREAEARAAPGGDPSRPLEVSSPAVVEPRAEGLPCPVCGGEVRVDEHLARLVDGQRLRVARVSCRRCAHTREIFFRLTGQG
ncbi:MAG TPA: hypothetical protein PK668_04050 [Myxococcota bacterium]|nr:hypothetical protein [Myxococcota bacterium]HRY92031.1 hypothetical protein [Myxococcota bacterium]HSA21078.1 hypothetical protein [Myxococcota bacterium]